MTDKPDIAPIPHPTSACCPISFAAQMTSCWTLDDELSPEPHGHASPCPASLPRS